ncbi:MAG: hypothetical protein AAGC85_07425 [Bacteroidota bacterium]
MSGLTRRVGRLMGLDDISRRRLTNFEVVEVPATYKTRFHGRGGIPLLEGETVYEQEEVAKESFLELKAVARDISAYKRLDKDKVFSFYLINQEKENIATSKEFAFKGNRDQAINELWKSALAGTNPPIVARDCGQWRLQWKDAKGTLILTSTAHYIDINTAEKAAQEFTSFLTHKTFFRTKEIGIFGFRVEDENGNCLARHPEVYSTVSAREKAIQLCWLHFQNELPQLAEGKLGEVFNEGGGVIFSLVNDLGKPILSSVESYTTLVSAWEALCHVLLWSKKLENYVCLDEPEKGVYTFYLLNIDLLPDEVAMATNPTYPSANDRDQALQGLVSYLQSKDLEYHLSQAEPTYSLLVKDAQGKVLLRSKYEEQEKLRFRSYTQAKVFLPIWLALASDLRYYQLIGQEGAFSFELFHPNGLGVGESPRVWPCEEDRDEALQSLINWIKELGDPQKLTISEEAFLTEEISDWVFSLQGPTDSLYIYGTIQAESEIAAKERLYRLIDLAADKESYKVFPIEPNCTFGLRLEDSNGEVVGKIPQIFTSAQKASRGREQLAEFIENKRMRISYPAREKKIFKYRLWDGKLNPVKVSEEVYESEVEAQEELNKFYESLANTDPLPDIFSPKAGTGQNCDGTKLDTYRTNHSCFPLLTLEEEPSGCRFHILPIPQDESSSPIPLLEGKIFPKSANSQNALASVKKSLNKLLTEERKYLTTHHPSQKLPFQFLAYSSASGTGVQDFVLDSSPSIYSRSALREEAIEEFVLAFSQLTVIDKVNIEAELVRAADSPNRIPELYQPTLALPGSATNLNLEIIFVGLQQASTEEDALNMAYLWLDYLKNETLLVIIDSSQAEEAKQQQNGFLLMICNDLGLPVARTSLISNTDADNIREEVIRFAERFPIVFVKDHFRIRIFDKEGGLLWPSNLRLRDFALAYNRYVDLMNKAKEKSYYLRIGNVNTCEYTFDIVSHKIWDRRNAHSSILAWNSGTYELYQQAQKKVEEAERQVNNEGFHVLEHILLRPRMLPITQLTYRPTLIFSNPDVFGQIHQLVCASSFLEKEIADQVWLAMIEVAKDRRAIKQVRENADLTQETCYYLALEGIQVEGMERQIHFRSTLAYQKDTGVASKEKQDNQVLSLEEAKNRIVAIAKNAGKIPEKEKLITHPSSGVEQPPVLFPICLEDDLENDLADDQQEQKLSICDPTNSPNDKVELYNRYIPLADPYSYWVTVIIPYWPNRFRDLEFRTFFEKALRTEAPAHIALRIVWVTPDELTEFEIVYQQWLAEISLPEGGCNVYATQNELVSTLNKLTNFYDQGKLAPVEDPKSRFFLNQTALG